MAEARKTNLIEMKDGRSVEFGQRGKLKKNIEILGEGVNKLVRITVDCINGDTHIIEFKADHPLFFEFAAHGVSQKLTDSITKADDFEDVSFGVSNQIGQLLNGVWTQRSSEGLVRGFSDLLEALRRIKKYEEGSDEFAALKTALVAKSEADIKLLKTNPGIKAILAQIASEKAVARAAKLAEETTTDADALAGLDI